MLDVHPDWEYLHGFLQEQGIIKSQSLNDVVEELSRHLSLPQGQGSERI